MLTLVVAVILVPTKLILTNPRFRMVAWWCGIVVVGYLLIALRGWRLLHRERFEIDEMRRQIIVEQMAANKSQQDGTDGTDGTEDSAGH